MVDLTSRASDTHAASTAHPIGPPPSTISIAREYVFEQRLQDCMSQTGVSEAREDSMRLQGVHYIDSVRKALRLPVRTFNTAAVYYHRFRLVHSDQEYSFVDAAAAALFTACKVEDTLKRSKEILCAAYNLKLPSSEQITQDDAMFEGPSKSMVGLERLMLEASAFDFRSHNPQRLLLKVARLHGVNADTVGKTAYNISIDLYRTFAPLKQTTATLALACVELAGRLHNEPVLDLEAGKSVQKWRSSRAEVMETLLDLLDLYTHHRAATLVGHAYPIEAFIAIRITLNQEVAANSYPRHTPAPSPASPALDTPLSNPMPGTRSRSNAASGATANGRTPNGRRTPKDYAISPISPDDLDGRHAAGSGTGTAATSSTSAGAAGGGATVSSTRDRRQARDGTVRYMLDGDRAKAERHAVDAYWKVEQEEYEVEVEVKLDRPERNDRHHRHDRRR